jgi:hypothetical protein
MSDELKYDIIVAVLMLAAALLISGLIYSVFP